jgi:25S rRNA (uracil2843-N3)-methyltransferase
VPAGTLLLVVDSPGSYSTVSLNGAEKKYPMQWLLDHTLLDEGPKGDTAAWSKLTEDESKWFRLDTRLRYPIELEDMRFQLHLYRRTA